MGERYAYVSIKNPHLGYEYVTTGGGMVLSKRALELAAKKFECDGSLGDSSPDDMALGKFFASSTHPEVPCTHSSQFHQRRPADYPGFSEGFANEVPPISFHNVFHTKDPAREIFEPYLMSESSDMIYT